MKVYKDKYWNIMFHPSISSWFVLMKILFIQRGRSIGILFLLFNGKNLDSNDILDDLWNRVSDPYDMMWFAAKAFKICLQPCLDKYKANEYESVALLVRLGKCLSSMIFTFCFHANEKHKSFWVLWFYFLLQVRTVIATFSLFLFYTLSTLIWK